MTPLETYIRQRLQRKKLLLMTHAVVGYPSLEANLRMLEAMQRADVDLVELQLPFSEPIADGPVFVRANQRALEAGMNWERYFTFMQRAASLFDFKLLLMGYYNSILQMGHDRFCACLAEHGGSGFIVADLPPEESGDLLQHADTHHLCPIVLMTPTNPMPRLHEIARHARGFIYCVARKGSLVSRHTSMTVWRHSWHAAAAPRLCPWHWASAYAPVLTCGVCMGWRTLASLALPCSRPGNRVGPSSTRHSCKTCRSPPRPEADGRSVHGNAATACHRHRRRYRTQFLGTDARSVSHPDTRSGMLT